MSNTLDDYQAPEQSPYWDDVVPLAQLLAEAKFFMLLKNRLHGDLVNVVLATIEPSKPGQDKRFEIRALNHDAAGVTCVASGTISAQGIQDEVDAGLAELTLAPERVLRHIWEVIHCHPNAQTKLFTEL